MRTDFTNYGQREEQAKVLYSRFHKVILSAGYSEGAALGILEQYFDEYMSDMSTFCVMLAEYEAKDSAHLKYQL